MSATIRRKLMYSALLLIAVIAALSVFSGIPYIYSACALSVWATVGHLITIDDDIPGEWGNMEGSSDVLRNARVALLIKCIIMLLLIFVVMAFPELSKYGA